MSWKHWRPVSLAPRLARGPVIAAALAITVAVSVLFSVWLSLFDASSLDLFATQLAFTPDRFIDTAGPWGPSGLSEFIRATATLDFIYPVAYAVAIGGLWARYAGPGAWATGAWPLAAILVAAASDWVENLLHLTAAAAMVDGNRPSVVVVFIGSAFAAIKWVLLVAALEATAVAAWRRPGKAKLAAIGIGVLAAVMAAAAAIAAF